MIKEFRSRLTNLIRPPIFEEDDDKTNSASIIDSVILVTSSIIILTIAGLFLTGLISFTTFDATSITVVIGLAFVLVNMGLRNLLFRGYVNQVGVGLVCICYLVSLQNIYSQGTFLNFASLTLLTPILLATFVFGIRNGIFAFLFSILVVAGINSAETHGWLPPRAPVTPRGQAILFFVNIGIFLGYIAIAQNLLLKTLRKSRASAQEQKRTNVELLELKASLETRVAERTTELTERSMELAQQSTTLEKINAYNVRRAAQFKAIAEVSKATTSIYNLGDLLPRITDVVSAQFGFYHVGIFLADEANQYAVLAAANSEGGQRMLKRGHRLKIGQVGIVGNVVGTGTPRIALDTGTDVVFFNNPDLPDTHSEMALPLRAGQTIIGALDVQSTVQNAFTQDDIEVLATLADQVSIAIQNARQYEDTQKALAEAEAIYRQSLRSEWKRVSQEKQASGFRYSLLGTQEIGQEVQTEEVQLALEKGDLQVRESAETSALAVPIKLRGEIIGVLNVRAPGGHSWNENELDVVQAVAERVAISAENARLFEETTSRAERERTVADITNKIRATNDPQEMITTALSELKRALNVNKIEIIPYSAQNKSE